MNPKVIILRTAGTNCDQETAFAFQSVGADVDRVHINKLLERQVRLNDYHILAVPGGFTYGDDIMSGKILANELRLKLGNDIRTFIDDGKLIIGICNGFQVLARAGILPGELEKTAVPSGPATFTQTVTLVHNDSGKFEARWVHLRLSGQSVWTEGIDDVLYLPVAHAEGKFIPQDKTLLDKLQHNGRVIFRYCTADGKKPRYPENPNGAVDDVAGIADRTGRILGLMPHPERHFLTLQHPQWTRLRTASPYGQGAKIFENGVRYVKDHLLRPAEMAKV